MSCKDQQSQLGDRIKAARKEAGLSQKELGNRIGLSYQTIAYWEKGIKTPRPNNLLHLADALDLPISYLLHDDNKQPEYKDDFSDQVIEDLVQKKQPSKLGENIKVARKAAGLSQKELGMQLGLSCQTIACWENGSRKPRHANLQRLADILDVTVGYLLYSGDKNREDVDASKVGLSDNLRILRKSKGLTQVDLSKQTGLSLRVIKDYENVNSSAFITTKHLEIISRVLGVRPEEILGCSITRERYEREVREQCEQSVLTLLNSLSIDGCCEAVRRVEEMKLSGRW